MHIAIFIYGMTGGGSQRRTLTLIRDFVRRGHRIDLVTVSPGGVLAKEVPPEVRRFTVKSRLAKFLPFKAPRKLKLFLARQALADYLRREKPEVLLSAASHASLPALRARRIAGTRIPLVLRLSNHLTASHSGAWNPYLRIRYRTACRLYGEADAAIAVSRGIAEDIARNTSLPQDRITTIYNPVFSPEMAERAKAPVSHPWLAAGNPPVILGVGRLSAQKDFAMLLRAFSAVRRSRQARLVILGEGGKRQELNRLAAELNISEDVAMPGFVDNPLAWMSRASLFVLSSAWEGMPGVIIEALASGCPVVSTDCPSGPAEILQDGAYGALVPVGDHEAMARAILAALESPCDRTRLRERAAEFSVENAVEAYLDVLTRVVQGV